MANYVENIKVANGESWPVRDVAAHEAIDELQTAQADFQETVNNVQTSVAGVQETVNKMRSDMLDTGWVDLAIGSEFKAYDTAASSTPKYRKIGDIVTVRGRLTPAENMLLDTTRHVVCSGLPADARPSISYPCLCTGSGSDHWLLEVMPDGTLTASRYGHGGTFVNISPGTWLVFTFTYMV
jgi:hypothetical protein